MLPEIDQRHEQCRCGKRLVVIVDPAPEVGPNCYMAWWRARKAAASEIKPWSTPMTLFTRSYCPSCGSYLPDFVRYDDRGVHFFCYSREEFEQYMFAYFGMTRIPGVGHLRAVEPPNKA